MSSTIVHENGIQPPQISSTTMAWFCITMVRLSFTVGVSSPDSRVKSLLEMRNSRIDPARLTWLLALPMMPTEPARRQKGSTVQKSALLRTRSKRTADR